MYTAKDIKPDWTFIRYGTVNGWIRVAIYRLPDGSVVNIRC